MTPGKRRLFVLSSILLIGAAPFISVSIAEVVASANQCRLDEAGIYPCVVHGHDFGNLLSTMFVAGWAGLVTIPAAICALMLWGAVALIRSGRRLKS
ncbi:hypothetical protein [Trinickia acidisoli]|uniref:hypothetical protein n=1 Tax=Trinickia acidisoli TaxID=2767482 RepID=UPI001A8F87A0|nr:hypothetical protein [Trinickia acidisoli]